MELPLAVDRYPATRYALVALQPHSGRSHQLRRHMKHIAHPIIGDATFGKGVHNRFFQQHFGCGRLLLACTQLGFTHPATGVQQVIDAPLAPGFSRLLQAMGWEIPRILPPRQRTPDPPRKTVDTQPSEELIARTINCSSIVQLFPTHGDEDGSSR